MTTTNRGGRPQLDPLANWWGKVDVGEIDDCWAWKAGRDKDGYGKFAVGLGGRRQRHTRAHIFAYETFIGTVPPGRQVCHRCNHPWCVNPWHLYAGTPQENRDDRARLQTHCKRNHPLFGDNVRIARGRRRCRTCDREMARAARGRAA